jgi:hypothetical protein
LAGRCVEGQHEQLKSVEVFVAAGCLFSHMKQTGDCRSCNGRPEQSIVMIDTAKILRWAIGSRQSKHV